MQNMLMRHFTIRLLAMVIVQQTAMISFMRVAEWQLFESAGAAALVGIAAGSAVYFIQRRFAATRSL